MISLPGSAGARDRRGWRGTALILAALVLAACEAEHGGWDKSEVRVSIGELPAEWQGAAVDAVLTWDAALAGRVRLVLEERDADVVMRVEAAETWSHAPGTLGTTKRVYGYWSGDMWSATVWLRSDLEAPGQDYDVRAIATHELGHALGLPDLDDWDATMFWSTWPGDTGKYTLEAVDLAALDELYPF